MAACRVKPRHTHSITLFHVLYARADRGDISNTFMSRDERQCGFDGPIAVGRVQIGMADARRLDVDENVTGAGLWNGDFLDAKRLAECMDYRGFHHVGHRSLLSVG
jgi:hypothetical protein